MTAVQRLSLFMMERQAKLAKKLLFQREKFQNIDPYINDNNEDESDNSTNEPIVARNNSEMKFEKGLTDCEANNVKSCRLCLDRELNESIEIFIESGQLLNVASVIAEHFWFKVS